jgi:hypothetical protein
MKWKNKRSIAYRENVRNREISRKLETGKLHERQQKT